MPSSSAKLAPPARAMPTIWGLSPLQVYDHFWASRGVQVVRQGENSEIVDDAELFLLLDPRSLVLLKLTLPVEQLHWIKPQILYLRLHDNRQTGYQETILTDDDDHFLRYQRVYSSTDSQLTRVALTTDQQIARRWQNAPSPRAGWRQLRQTIPAHLRATQSLPGRVFDASREPELMDCLRHIIQVWKRPDSTIQRARRNGPSVWRDSESPPQNSVTFVGQIWIGAGRQIDPGASVVGPAVLWDDPSSRPENQSVQWREIEPIQVLDRPIAPRKLTSAARVAKRAFDIAFALLGLALTLPLYPLIALAVMLQDGWPIFFMHRRETLAGREFPCIKFRSMWKNADRVKQQLARANQADGPQFFIENDPRLTRVGIFLRRFQLDEIPQFWNILLGHMSVVGPRPSPRSENQFCPAWREARLSVRPGLTGLWQVNRTRQAGLDFQEWIRYDIEYVENISWKLDLWIIWQTILIVLKGFKNR
ncbi:MAG: sugar transferase [Phycisphaeraceae bacterium]|nr:sugar transferase [Phycisphaeraceae bacterium]